MDEGRTAGRPGPKAITGEKPRLFRNPKRVAVVGIGLFFVAALIAGTISSADTSDLSSSQTVPKEIQSYSPAPGAIVSPTAPIVVDLRDDLIGEFTVCAPTPSECTPVPLDQTEVITSLGQVTFRPTDKTDITQYPSGPVTVRVDYRLQGSQSADAGSFTWSFLVKA